MAKEVLKYENIEEVIKALIAFEASIADVRTSYVSSKRYLTDEFDWDKGQASKEDILKNVDDTIEQVEGLCNGIKSQVVKFLERYKDKDEQAKKLLDKLN